MGLVLGSTMRDLASEIALIQAADEGVVQLLSRARAWVGATRSALVVGAELTARWNRIALNDQEVADRLVAEPLMGAGWVTTSSGICFLDGKPEAVHEVSVSGQLDLLVALAALLARQATELAEISERSRELDLTRRRLEEQNILLSELSVIDSLTGLHNRRFLERRLAYEVERARRYQRELALLVVDIDHFKRVNDTYGHSAGDAVLRTVAGALRDVCRRQDLIARYGGEEFVVVAPETDALGARAVAERLRASVHAQQFTEGPEWPLTVSIGVAILGDRSDPNALFRAADAALYQAKRGGRDRAVFELQAAESA
jgi:diguanylate cyclase (GGDEF)-like protein